jgi:MFS family permease
VSRWFERRRGTVLGIVLIGSNVGAAVVNLLAKGMYRGFDDQWRPAIVILGVIMVALVLPFSLWVIRDPRREEVPSGEHATAAERAGAPGSPAAPAPDVAADGRWPTSSQLADAVGTRGFWLLFFALFAYYFYYLFVNRHIIALLRDVGSFGHTVPAPLVSLLGVSPQDFPEFTKSMFEAVGLPGKLLAGYLVDRYRVRHALAWNFVLLAVGSALLPVLDGSGVIWLFIAVNGLGWGAQQVLTPMAIASTFGLRHMGQIYGTLMIVLFPAHISPWYAGRLFDLAGTYQAFFTPCVALNVLAAAGLFLLRPPRA